MKIAFDAKRAYHNGTGLGHYSRTLISSLASYFPSNKYYLCNPKPGSYFELKHQNVVELRPQNWLSKLFSSAWRSKWVKNDLHKLEVDIYHGLSHEIPLGIQKTKIKAVVTIHDLIHERYPEQYNKIDVKIYRQKFSYACKKADHIIAISNQTKADIIHFYGINPNKISVCYQSCNKQFAIRIDSATKKSIRQQYNLPEQFFFVCGLNY